jgi:hypothetical protein
MLLNLAETKADQSVAQQPANGVGARGLRIGFAGYELLEVRQEVGLNANLNGRADASCWTAYLFGCRNHLERGTKKSAGREAGEANYGR